MLCMYFPHTLEKVLLYGDEIVQSIVTATASCYLFLCVYNDTKMIKPSPIVIATFMTISVTSL